MIDLSKTDTYDNHIVPEDHVEITMKVLRTIRDLLLCPKFFDADGAVALSHAYKIIYERVKVSQK